MTRAYSSDLRIRVIGAVERGQSARAAAVHFGVSINTGIRWVRRFKQTGEATAVERRGRRASRLDPHTEWLLELVAETPDLTLAEIRGHLAARGVTASTGLVWNFYRHHGFSFKKSGACRRAGAARRGGGAGGVAGDAAGA